MKKFFWILMACFVLTASQAWACDVCQDKQPRALKGITHGTGPQDDFDYIIISVSIVIVALTFVFSLRYLISPKESDSNHIKHSVLQ